MPAAAIAPWVAPHKAPSPDRQAPQAPVATWNWHGQLPQGNVTSPQFRAEDAAGHGRQPDTPEHPSAGIPLPFRPRKAGDSVSLLVFGYSLGVFFGYFLGGVFLGFGGLESSKAPFSILGSPVSGLQSLVSSHGSPISSLRLTQRWNSAVARLSFSCSSSTGVSFIPRPPELHTTRQTPPSPVNAALHQLVTPGSPPLPLATSVTPGSPPSLPPYRPSVSNICLRCTTGTTGCQSPFRSPQPNDRSSATCYTPAGTLPPPYGPSPVTSSASPPFALAEAGTLGRPAAAPSARRPLLHNGIRQVSFFPCQPFCGPVVVVCLLGMLALHAHAEPRWC